MDNRWRNEEVEGAGPVEQLIYQSRLVGAEESLVLWGGGNNSLKANGQDLLGREIPTMFIKSSGSDMKSITARQFPAVRLDYIAPLEDRAELSDDAMVDYLAQCLLDPKSPRPSIETLLHAFLPYRAILHTHADAILSLTNTVGQERTVRECFGERVLTVPYRRPGFELSKLVGQAARQQPNAAGLILMNHGLITWGETPAEAYARHIELVNQAEEFVWAEGFMAPKTVKGGGSFLKEIKVDEAQTARLAPILRGLLSVEQPVVLELDQSWKVLHFLDRPDADKVTQIGPVTPDHLLYTKRYPLFVNPDPQANLHDQLEEALVAYSGAYREYFQRFALSDQTMLDPWPKVILMPEVGMWTVGKDARAARIVRDIYLHTMDIIDGATAVGGYATLDDSYKPQSSNTEDTRALGGYATLTDKDAYEAEYWPMELYKLTLLPPEKELARRIALVTGAASGIGRAIALRLAAEGAHVIVTDINEAGAVEVAEGIVQKEGLRRAMGLRLDVTDPASVSAVFGEVCRTYGGLDILVSNAGIAQVGAIDRLSLADWERSLAVNTTGHFLVVRAALDIMKAQRTGGSIVFNATKNVTAPGKDFGAYSVAKAAEAQLCRIVAIEGGEFGIRANMLNPDAIFEGSQLWSEELKQQRAAAYGLPVEQLPDFYRQRNLLKAAVSAEDVAEAALFLAGPRSAKTTGAMLPVDGGVKEAFPR